MQDGRVDIDEFEGLLGHAVNDPTPWFTKCPDVTAIDRSVAGELRTF